jgi:hypothetical protein
VTVVVAAVASQSTKKIGARIRGTSFPNVPPSYVTCPESMTLSLCLPTA